MKPTSLALRVVLPLLCATHFLHAQNFTPPEVWTSEDFTQQRMGSSLLQPNGDFAWTTESAEMAGQQGSPTLQPEGYYAWMTNASKVAIGNNYKDMLYALPGNFNGAVNTYNGASTPVQSVAFLFGVDDPSTLDPTDKYLAVYTLESRGYHLYGNATPTPLGNVGAEYHYPEVVNQQEGLNLYDDHGDHTAYTYHPTIWRFDKSVMPIRVNTIKAAVSGDFTGDGQDEIALLVKDGTGQKVIIIRCYNYFGEALNYPVFAYSPMSVPVTTMDFDNIRFACSGHYTEQHSKIAVLYDNPNGQQEIYTFEPGSPWSLVSQYSRPKSTFDIAKVRFVASGLFEHGSPTPRMAIGYRNDATSTEKIYITRDYGSGWVLDERFSKPRSQFDFDKVRHVVAGAFDGVAGDDELAMFYDHGDDATGLGSVQQVLLTTHDTPWNTTVAINEKRSALDFDKIKHAYAANLDYNSGPRRDEIGIVYQEPTINDDAQDFTSGKVLVYTNRPPFAENDFMMDVNQPVVNPTGIRPFFPLGLGAVRRDQIAEVAQRAGGAYNTLWLNALFYNTVPPTMAEERDYMNTARAHNFFSVPETQYENYSSSTFNALLNSYTEIANNRPANSVIAYGSADEPDGHNVPASGIMAVHNALRSGATPATEPMMPIMSTDNGSEFYRDITDLVCIDGYSYAASMTNPPNTSGVLTEGAIHAALQSAFRPHRAMETAIRYNKSAFIFIPQGTAIYEHEHSRPRTWIPSLEQFRYNSMAPVIEGTRGLLYYAYNIDNNEVMRHRVDLVAEELSHYIPALSTQSLAGRVTIDKHCFVPADFDAVTRKYFDTKNNVVRVDYKGGKTRYMSLFSYALHHDPNSNRYYLFVANNWSLPVEDVELTAFGVPATVSYLPAEYFQNGHSVPMNARDDQEGGYVTFHDSFKGNEVKIYALGDLPTVDATVQTFQGDLSFSNQRKLAAAPVTTEASGAPLYRSDIYYHLVYHRLNPITGRKEVYYRRSKSSKRDIPMETVVWEPWEMCLSDDIVSADGTPVTSVDCAHPSIVVRYDLVSHMNKAYVVFNCSGGPEAPGGYVVESIIAADVNYVPPVVAPRAHGIASYVGRNLDEWGTPMINASSSGNYYVWADSLSGINAGWKLPKDIALAHTAAIHWNASGFRAQHPSLNSYSHITDLEDNCALVWQESGEGGHADIYYTRLHGDAGGIGIYLPSAPPRHVPLTINPGNTIVRVSDGNYGVASDNRMPMVNRCEELGQLDGPPSVGSQLMDIDGIYWETRMVPDNNPTVIPEWMRYGTIGYRSLSFYDRWSGTRWEPNYWYGASARWIWSSRRNLSQPTVAPGAPVVIEYPYASDRAVLLDFIATDPLNLSTSLWHLAHGYTTLNRSDDDNGFRTSLVNADEIGGPVQSPQLASQPFIGGPVHWFRSQRVFNSGTALGIVASRSFLTKSAVADLKPCPLFGFGNASGFSLVSPFLLNGGAISLALPQWDSVAVNPPDPGDTVRTRWFTVGARQQLEFVLLGKTVTSGIGGGSPRTELWIERKLTGARMQIALPAGDDIEGVPVACSLVNGADEEYRLLVVNRDTTSRYAEHLVLDGMPVSDTVYADTAALHKGPAGSGLDLGLLRGSAMAGGATLAVYPNPATDKMVITLGGGSGVLRAGGKATLTITSALGTVVDRREIEPMRGVELDVAGLASGIYFVNVGTGDGAFAMASFVVQR